MSLVTICHHMKSHTFFHVMRATCKFHTIILLTMIAHSWAIGVPDSSVGKESGCNAGNPDSIPGSGRFTGEGVGYPFQCSWTSLVMVIKEKKKIHLPMQETRVWSLGWEDPLEKEMASHSSVLAWEIPWTEESGGLQSVGSQRVEHDWAHERTHTHTHIFESRLLDT